MRHTAIAAALAATIALAACEPDGLADQIAREEAKEVVNPILAARFPGVAIAPYTDCIIDNASAEEIFRLAAASATRPGREATELVLDIAQRRGTVECITRATANQVLVIGQ